VNAVQELRSILLTTDLSEPSARAVPHTLSLARRYGAAVLVLHVVEDLLPPLFGEYTAVPLEEILSSQLQRARQELQRFVSRHVPRDFTTEQILSRGIAHVEILRLAEERQLDLIVMATHGRGFISHALFGSTTERVVRKAPCPVLTVRASPQLP
jgi:nucleotide-binding universal stress UspA family protein